MFKNVALIPVKFIYTNQGQVRTDHKEFDYFLRV